ncbi:protease complex subunit PrcB family protein [Chryseobacterium sp. MYb264]|uniref:protease complex subunit PrcB family protein n=1 Tax=Chryseobacterium sp. MYb264 TaxID=2745153 RepID=UPI002E1512D4|nr:protease complex subunit PrcB family protein [Chryseobacterium sp. MYb264]
MKRLIILSFATFLSCASTGNTSQKSSDMQTKTEIIASESQGGADQAGFKIIKNESELQKAMQGNSVRLIVEGSNTEPAKTTKFPKDKKVVLYNLGMFRSGDHRIATIKSVSVKDNVLYVEVPYVEQGEMQIQVISNPYIIFTVPSTYNFTSVELKSSK